jgi:hypothetical protein
MNKFYASLLMTPVFLISFLLGCSHPTPRAKDYSHEMKELRSIAILCGGKKSRVQHLSMLELITDIKIRFNDSEKFYGESLNKEEWKDISDLLYAYKKALKKIKNYDQFIKKIDGKRIIILPDTSR